MSKEEKALYDKEYRNRPGIKEKIKERQKNNYYKYKDRQLKYQKEYLSRPEIRLKTNQRAKIKARDNPEKEMWKRAKARANRESLPFNIEVSDIIIPNKCPILDITLQNADGFQKENSPSLDKIIPELGYVKGNIAVISMAANTRKGNLTTDQVRSLLKYMENYHI